jgi:hypothetical protein
MDQPRVMVPYEDTQEYLRTEALTRSLPNDAQGVRVTGILGEVHVQLSGNGEPGWVNMIPDTGTFHADKLYKSPSGGFVTNFTASSDLCTVGPVLGENHGS